MTRPRLFEQLLLASALGVILVFTSMLGLLTSYAVAAIALAFALFHLARGRGAQWSLEWPGGAFLAAFAAIAVLFALTARQPADIVFAFNFAAFLFYVPLATLFGRGAASGNATLVAWLALSGAGIACAASLYEVYGLGHSRAGSVFSDHIRLANTAVILGFLALIGTTRGNASSRWIFLLGPVLAVIVVLLTGARIAMLAYPVLALGAALLLVRRKVAGLLLGAIFVTALLVAGYSGWFGGARLASLFSVVSDIMEGKPVADEAVRIRLELYKAGWAAFLDSPLVGHGWARLMSAPAEYLAASDQHRASLPHLHNELLNFAVAGGLAGVLIYLGLLVAPVAAALRSARDSQYRARLVGVCQLVLAYIVMGATDTMLSFELHTTLFVGFTAILIAFCRDRKTPGEAGA